jgi:molybdate transport system substrate-binding protein
VFDEIGEAFSEAYPDATVTFAFDASSALVQQIIQGAPADVFASADVANMDKLTAAGLNGTDPVVFATNSLEIIVGPGNPLGISGLADLAGPALKVVLCAPEVPCGRYAAESLMRAGVTVAPASFEQNVKGVVTKVIAGEADAGIVYATDVKAAGAQAAGVEIPVAVNVVATYPIASVESSEEGDVDEAFIAFVTGPEGRAILATYGFGAA